MLGVRGDIFLSLQTQEGATTSGPRIWLCIQCLLAAEAAGAFPSGKAAQGSLPGGSGARLLAWLPAAPGQTGCAGCSRKRHS